MEIGTTLSKISSNLQVNIELMPLFFVTEASSITVNVVCMGGRFETGRELAGVERFVTSCQARVHFDRWCRIRIHISGPVRNTLARDRG